MTHQIHDRGALPRLGASRLTQLRRVADVLATVRKALDGPPTRRFGPRSVCRGAGLGTRRLTVIAVGGALAVVSLTGTGSFGEPAASAAGYSAKVYRYDSRLLADKPPFFSGSASMPIPDARVTNYLFFTNFETVDPGLDSEPSGCAGKYYSEWRGRYSCDSIISLSGDRIEGPYHTNDAANVEGSAEFGRAGAEPPDVVEIDGGTYPEDLDGQCTGMPIFHTATHCYVRGERIALPEGSSGLAKVVEGEDAFSGETRLELDGSTNTIRVVNFRSGGVEYATTIKWPRNGLIYVSSRSCGWPTATSSVSFNADGPEEARSEKGCGNVYVRGTYSQPLTIAAQEDLIVDGSIYPTSVAGQLGAAPSGTATLGLIAGDYVRVYHPTRTGAVDGEPVCGENVGASEDPNGWGAQPDIWIYASILAADHAFVVDNWACGSQLGNLDVYGSIAQNYRGVIGTAGGGGGVISAPLNTTCASRRRFTVHIVQIPDLRYRGIKVVFNGHRVATRTTRSGVTAEVDLRGLPKGAYVLRIMLETTHGRRITATRTYHTCAATPIHPKRPPTL